MLCVCDSNSLADQIKQEYCAAFSKWRTSYSAKYFAPGAPGKSFVPVVHFMLLIGTIGYTVEWIGLGRHHAAHARHEREEGMKLLNESHSH